MQLSCSSIVITLMSYLKKFPYPATFIIYPAPYVKRIPIRHRFLIRYKTIFKNSKHHEYRQILSSADIVNFYFI